MTLTRRGRAAILGLLGPVAALLLGASAADDPADRLKDPAQEARARALFKEFRCLVCQNQSIDESDADLAEDLRRIVRAKVAKGESDRAIKRFVVERYGEFALERPELDGETLLLWGAPFAALLVGGAALWRGSRRNLAPEPPLTPDEEAALARSAGVEFGENSQGSAAFAPHERP